MDMKEKIFDKWVKALRSGDYKLKLDGVYLVEVKGKDHLFHPLGVLAAIAPVSICDFGGKGEYEGDKYIFITHNKEKYLHRIPDTLADWAGMPGNYCDRLDSISDWPGNNNYTLEEMIDWMEENL